MKNHDPESPGAGSGSWIPKKSHPEANSAFLGVSSNKKGVSLYEKVQNTKAIKFLGSFFWGLRFGICDKMPIISSHLVYDLSVY